MKVIAYSVFGPESYKYTKYLPAVEAAHRVLFPDYMFAVHRESLIRTEPRPPLCKAMLFRLGPLFWPNVDAVFCRDIDSLPTPRDRAACEEFLVSDADVHTIHDAPVHDGMLGGLCGFKASVRRGLAEFGVRSLEDFYDAAEQAVCATPHLAQNFSWERKGADQDALNCFIVPNFRVLVHANPGRNHRGFFSQYKSVIWRPTPQIGSGLPTDKLFEAEALSPFLGAPGFNVEKALAFYGGLIDAAHKT